jgi:hypothetical protein
MIAEDIAKMEQKTPWPNDNHLVSNSWIFSLEEALPS